MNIYSRRIQVKYLLFFSAVIIGVGSLWYTNRLVEKLANEERKKVELWAKATNLIANYDLSTESLSFMIEVIQNNETVPVIIVDEKDSIRFYRNIDSAKINNPVYVKRFLEKLKSDSTVISIDLGNNRKQYLYYDRSIILTKLTYYPFVQLSVILLFIFVAYLAFNSSRKAEQNQVWVGLSKETAHQLGTPISSLMAWKEILKLKSTDVQLISELEKDVTRLEKITDRFSKIGSKPRLKPEDVNIVIESAVEYLKTRSSKNIEYSTDTSDVPVIVPLNVPLFEWVLENICKNAMDAIDGKGKIQISVTDNGKFVFIDITDNGKGIPRSKHNTIFKPGYTTKERGWGLGLSLTKRIVEEYHGGKIFVSASEPGKGTTFRIILNAEVK
jgi:two-component system, sporulation sensor kinase D